MIISQRERTCFSTLSLYLASLFSVCVFVCSIASVCAYFSCPLWGKSALWAWQFEDDIDVLCLCAVWVAAGRFGTVSLTLAVNYQYTDFCSRTCDRDDTMVHAITHIHAHRSTENVYILSARSVGRCAILFVIQAAEARFGCVMMLCMTVVYVAPTHTHTKPEPNNTYTAVANDVCVCAAHVCVEVPVSVWMEWMLYTRAWPIHMYVLALCVCCMCVCATSKCRGIQFICAYCHTIACGGAVHNRTCPSHLLNERTNGSEPLLMARLSLIVCRSFAQRFLLFYMWFHFWVLSSTSHTAAVYMLPRSCHCWLAAVVDGSVCCACSQCPFMFHSYLVILLAGRCCCCFFFYFSLFVVCWCFVCVWQIVPAVVFNAM